MVKLWSRISENHSQEDPRIREGVGGRLDPAGDRHHLVGHGMVPRGLVFRVPREVSSRICSRKCECERKAPGFQDI